MNLFRETGNFLYWYGRVGARFLRRRPLTTTAVVVASGLGSVVSILAFLLPLKIIFVAASDGAYRQVQMIMGLQGKESLVVALTAASVVAFFALPLLDALTDRLTTSTSRSILHGSNGIAVVKDQVGEARTIHAQFADVAAGALFTLAALAAIGWLTPLLGAGMAGAFIAEFILTAVILALSDEANPRFLSRMVRKDYKGYVKFLSSLNFMFAFGILLYPFVWGAGGNIVAALVSFIILRRALGITARAVQGSVKLYRRKPVIDALVFREHQYQGLERGATRTLRDVFHKSARQARTSEALRGAGVEFGDLDVRWEDAPVRGLGILDAHVEDRGGARASYQQQIYFASDDYRQDNEAVLFSYIGREQLRAPRLLLSFTEGPFQCQLCTAGVGEFVAQSDWQEAQRSLTERMMALRPPAGLVRAFTVSRPLLADRLSDDLVERVEVAVDTEQEAAVFEAFRRSLAGIHARLRELPLYIYNPEIKRSNVRLDDDRAPLVMTWGEWVLEPVGAGLPDGIRPRGMGDIVAAVRRARSDLPADFDAEHLRFANRCWSIERQIRQNFLKAALRSIEQLLESPVLAEPEGELAAPARRAQGAA